MKYLKEFSIIKEDIATLKKGLEVKKALEDGTISDKDRELYENGEILKIVDEERAKNSIVELETEQKKGLKALEQVLHRSAIGKKVFILKQASKVRTNEYGIDEYDGTDLQVCVTDSPSLIRIDDSLLYVTIRNLKRRDVKAIQNLWKTVGQRGTTRYLEGKDNDYYMTFDCVTIDEHKKLQFMISCDLTPLFCSSDGDEDLTLTYIADTCSISISQYNKAEAEYEALKREEQGIKVNKHWRNTEEESYEKQEAIHDVMFHPEISSGDDTDNGSKYN